MARDTCWTLIRSAAEGEASAREDFARRYRSVVLAYLVGRWRGGPHADDVEDATQEVFLRCYQPGGPLARAESEREGGFQAYLFGVTRNVARSFEARRAQRRSRDTTTPPVLDEFPGNDERFTVIFDRAFAHQLMREARELLARRAAEDPDARRRVELLRLRFEEGLPIRDIAARWEVSRVGPGGAAGRGRTADWLRRPPSARLRGCGRGCGPPSRPLSRQVHAAGR